jgi:hypothetical protein
LGSLSTQDTTVHFQVYPGFLPGTFHSLFCYDPPVGRCIVTLVNPYPANVEKRVSL